MPAPWKVMRTDEEGALLLALQDWCRCYFFTILCEHNAVDCCHMRCDALK